MKVADQRHGRLLGQMSHEPAAFARECLKLFDAKEREIDPTACTTGDRAYTSSEIANIGISNYYDVDVAIGTTIARSP